jgi:NADPH-dependent 7-cyano-7-deazaguanine reductase QueF
MLTARQRARVDFGKEFWNNEVKDYLDSVGVVLYKTENETKSACAERIIRTLKDKIEPKLTQQELEGYRTVGEKKVLVKRAARRCPRI